MTTEDSTPATNPLADPGVRRALEEFVRRRVPGPDVDDIVQTVLCDALAAEGRPDDPAELRRWLTGIARHKVADFHRRMSREEASELPDLPVAPPPIEARELARWAEEQAASTRDAKQTLAWMAREGEGEKLESIAAEEQIPAARVRQRVSRMRRWMKERWLAELAAVAALAVLVILAIRLLREPEEQPQTLPVPEPVPRPTAPPELPAPLDRARALRAEAFEACDRAAWQQCLDRLDEAAALDPAGDATPEVQAARQRARDALVPPQAPKSKKLDEKEAPAPVKSEPTSTPAPTPAPKPTAPPQRPVTKGKPSPKSTLMEMKMKDSK